MSAAVRDISALKPIAQEACTLFLGECNKRGISIFITETYRSQERQNELYALGRTKPGQIVTWTRKSRHTSGLAWDIAVKPPLQLYDKAVLYAAGQVAIQLGMTWGGSWKTPDYPHIEITEDWREPVMDYDTWCQYMDRYLQEQLALTADKYAADSWAKATAKGVLDGTMPQAPVQRQQLACVLDRVGLLDMD